MQTPEFAAEMDWLTARPELAGVAVMCAGGGSVAMPSVADRGRGGSSRRDGRGHLCDDRGRELPPPHTITEFARVEGVRGWYPGTEGQGTLPLFA